MSLNVKLHHEICVSSFKFNAKFTRSIEQKRNNSGVEMFVGRYSESAAVHSRRSSQVLLIPDSPPPEYTPRHTKIM